MITIELEKPVPYHVDYTKRKRRFDFWELSYCGGPDYKSGKDADGQNIFVDHEQESDKGTTRRKRLSVYRNYCRPVVQKYNNYIFSNPVSRPVMQDTTFKDFSDDVDLSGTTFADFIKHSGLWAAVLGQWFVLAESTKSDEGKTLAQAQVESDRLYFIDIDPRRVVNWEMLGGKYTSLLIDFPDESKARLYTDEKITTIDIDIKTKQVAKITVEQNDFGQIPVEVCCVLEDQQSQLADIAEVNKSLFNLDSLMREELQKQTFTQWFATIPRTSEDGQKPKLEDMSFGGRKIIFFEMQKDDTVTFTKLTSDVSQAESIRSSITADIAEIYRLAGLQNPDVIQNTESGRALKLRLNDTALNAASIADRIEKFENRLIKLWSIGMNPTAPQEFGASDFPEDFNSEDLITDLESTLQVLDSDLPPTFKKEQVKYLADRYFPKLNYDTKNELLAEIEDAFNSGQYDEAEPEPNQVQAPKPGAMYEPNKGTDYPVNDNNDPNKGK